jgi:hypothetical protein
MRRKEAGRENSSVDSSSVHDSDEGKEVAHNKDPRNEPGSSSAY